MISMGCIAEGANSKLAGMDLDALCNSIICVTDSLTRNRQDDAVKPPRHAYSLQNAFRGPIDMPANL